MAQALFGIPQTLLTEPPRHEVQHYSITPQSTPQSTPQARVVDLSQADVHISIGEPGPRRISIDDPEATPQITEKDFAKLRLPDLKALAKHAGVSAAGTKAVLAKRLTQSSPPLPLPAQFAHLQSYFDNDVTASD